MAYSEFTLSKAVEQFGLTHDDTVAWAADLPPAPPSDLLRQFLTEGLPLAVAIGTEKARSELIVAPILLDARRRSGGRVSLFSGVDFPVDAEAGLTGVCDFLLSLSPWQHAVEAPAVAVVEAKNDNIKSGLGQCLAAVVAAQRFNDRRGHPLPAVYGVVTTGSLWKYLRLTGDRVALDPNEYPVSELDRVVGVLAHMLAPQTSTPEDRP